MKKSVKHNLEVSSLTHKYLLSSVLHIKHTHFPPRWKNPKSRNSIKMKVNNFVFILTTSSLSSFSSSRDSTLSKCNDRRERITPTNILFQKKKWEACSKYEIRLGKCFKPPLPLLPRPPLSEHEVYSLIRFLFYPHRISSWSVILCGSWLYPPENVSFPNILLGHSWRGRLKVCPPWG